MENLPPLNSVIYSTRGRGYEFFAHGGFDIGGPKGVKGGGGGAASKRAAFPNKTSTN